MKKGSELRIFKPNNVHYSLFSAIKKYWPFYVMLAPGIIWYVIFRYVPIYGLIITFKDFNFASGILGSSWAHPWYKYFMMFFQSPYFVQILSNTLIISILKLVFGFTPPIILAILLSECRISWFKRFVQTLQVSVDRR